MEKQLRILILEDVPTDAELIERELRKEGYAFTSRIVETRESFLEQMKTFDPDIVLSDYMMPQFNGMEALELVNERFPSTPLIIVTGSMNEETAVHCLKNGAADYVIKESLSRLGPAVKGALENKRNKEEKEAAIKAFHRKAKEWQVTFDTIDDVICILDSKNRIVRCNKATQETIGRPFGDIIGKRYWELLYKSSEPIAGCPVVEMRKSGHKESLEVELDGRWLYAQAYPVFEETRELFEAILIISDVTERKQSEKRFKKAQAQLLEAEKLGALGTLTAGIAHELNNPMMGMINYSQYCLKHVPKTNKAFSVLEDMVRETERCIDIVKNLLTFSRMEKENDEEFDKIHCSVIVDRVINLLKYRLEKENVSVKRSGEDDLPEIFAKVSNLQQVFLNLIGNALDALSGKKDKIIEIQAVSETNAIRIDISDSGCGIDEKYLTTIFDPFFTTKPPGKGTGLGLSVCRSIVEAHNGKISCDSEPGKWTTFRVMLPKRIESSSG